MKTAEYLAMVREKTGLTDYRIAKEYDINQSNLSKYSSGKTALSETHAWLIANILDINPAEVVAHTKFEQAVISGNKSKAKFWQEQLNFIFSTDLPIKIQISQFNPIVGDLINNAEKIKIFANTAVETNADLVVFPELALTGYPPEDLLLRDGFMEEVEFQIDRLCNELPSSVSVLFGAPSRDNNCLFNSAYLIRNNIVSQIYNKQELPNYGVFDEKRYFSAGNDLCVFECKNTRIGVLICEDQWVDGPISNLAKFDIDMVISINASPFQQEKSLERLDLCKKYAKTFGVEYIYVNLVGGQDEIVFDGGSFVLDANGSVVNQLPSFKEYSCHHNIPNLIVETESTENAIYSALVLATRDYVHKNNFESVVIGLSGGIDSALTLSIAVDAVGSENVHAVMMPYQFTSNISLDDSELQANTQGVKYSVIDIEEMVTSFNMSLSKLFLGASKDTTEENIQARIRGVLLMAISNKHHKMVLSTGNKSEMSVGYATLYGDMCGGFAPLKDISKTMVYRLANYRNTLSMVIPERVINRPPSAELSPNQVDQDSLPPYDVLDDILMRFVEMKQSVESIIDAGHEADIVNKVTRMVLMNEYKRRQSAPGPKISSNAFGKERRYPITSKFQP